MSAAPKRPRHWAYEMVDAWVLGQPTESISRIIPANDAPLAKTHARIFCLNIQHHAKYTADLEPLGKQMARWVAQYRNRNTRPLRIIAQQYHSNKQVTGG